MHGWRRGASAGHNTQEAWQWWTLADGPCGKIALESHFTMQWLYWHTAPSNSPQYSLKVQLTFFKSITRHYPLRDSQHKTSYNCVKQHSWTHLDLSFRVSHYFSTEIKRLEYAANPGCISDLISDMLPLWADHLNICLRWIFDRGTQKKKKLNKAMHQSYWLSLPLAPQIITPHAQGQ